MKILNIITVILYAYCSAATASVVLSGTRIIYPGENISYSAHLSNNSDENYLIQTEVTDAKENKSNDFIITPQYFKIAPHAGQVLRIRYAGRKLPDNRETLFYFTFTQIPSIKKKSGGNAEMIFAVSNKVKLIYRPGQLEDGNLKGHITLKKPDGKWVVFNNSPYIASIKKVAVTCESSSSVILENATIEPFSSLNVEKKPGHPCGKNADFSYVYLNDYGVDITVKERL